LDARRDSADVHRNSYQYDLVKTLGLMKSSDSPDLEFTVSPTDVDEDQFVSIWNIASSTMGGNAVQTRTLASRLLGFLCKHRCGLLTVSSTDAKYLDDWFERDNSLLYDWKPESEKVDVLSQHAYVPFDAFCNFVRANKFKSDQNHSPRRADRVDWFTNDWNVG